MGYFDLYLKQIWFDLLLIHLIKSSLNYVQARLIFIFFGNSQTNKKTCHWCRIYYVDAYDGSDMIFVNDLIIECKVKLLVYIATRNILQYRPLWRISLHLSGEFFLSSVTPKKNQERVKVKFLSPNFMTAVTREGYYDVFSESSSAKFSSWTGSISDFFSKGDHWKGLLNDCPHNSSSEGREWAIREESSQGVSSSSDDRIRLQTSGCNLKQASPPILVRGLRQNLAYYF